MIRHTKQFKPKETLTSKVVKTQDNRLLLKYGSAYFPLRSIEKTNVSQRTKSLLNSYPCWFLKESLINTEEFIDVFKQMISADPKEVYIFEEKQKTQKSQSKSKVLASVVNIKFSCLKVLHIMLTKEVNFEEIAWLDAPVLEDLYISTVGAFTSLKPLEKSKFQNLLIIVFRNTGQDKKMQPHLFDLRSFHRTKFLKEKARFPLKLKAYTPPGTISVCRKDLSNISFLAKLQIGRLTNFHIPHLELNQNKHHRFTPNAEYPWCPQLQFSQSRVYKALNNRFGNKTIALSIVDYVFGEGHDHDNVNIPNYNNEDDDYDEIDSDLDRMEERGVEQNPEEDIQI